MALIISQYIEEQNIIATFNKTLYTVDIHFYKEKVKHRQANT